MISRIGFRELPKINFTGRSENPMLNKLERTPLKDSVSFTSAAYIKMSPEAREYWENEKFDFEMGDGSILHGTVKDFLEASIINSKPVKEAGQIYHNLYTTNVGKKILEEGLDWTKAIRRQAGPGTYFSPSASCGFQYGLTYNAVSADYKGEMKEYPIMENGFYDRLVGATGIPAKVYHEIMVDDLGIDFIYSGIHGGAAYVVLNGEPWNLGRWGNW